jgi:hypothetical protein
MRVCVSGLSLGPANLQKQVFQLGQDVVKKAKDTNLAGLSRSLKLRLTERHGQDVAYGF